MRITTSALRLPGHGAGGGDEVAELVAGAALRRVPARDGGRDHSENGDSHAAHLANHIGLEVALAVVVGGDDVGAQDGELRLFLKAPERAQAEVPFVVATAMAS
jgi:hypothetical protein